MNVVEATKRTYVTEPGQPPRYIGGHKSIFSNLLKAYEATSLELEKEGIEMQSYATIQRAMTPEVQTWTKTFRTDGAEIWISFTRIAVI